MDGGRGGGGGLEDHLVTHFPTQPIGCRSNAVHGGINKCTITIITNLHRRPRHDKHRFALIDQGTGIKQTDIQTWRTTISDHISLVSKFLRVQFVLCIVDL